MKKLLIRILRSRIGGLLYRPLQPLVRLSRRRRNPSLLIAELAAQDQTITNVYYGERKFSITHRWQGSDRSAIAQSFDHAQYEMPTGKQGELVAQMYSDIIASGRKPLIVDCGAHIGASVLWFTARYPEAHIVGIEPSPVNFAFLRRNCAGFNVDLRLAGVGSVDGTAWMSDPSEEWRCRTNNIEEGIPVDILSIETLLVSKSESEYAPFILKVDIEGAEKSLFNESPDSFDRFPLILIEPHDWMLPGQQTSVGFFRFHAYAGREFAMKDENVASIKYHRNIS